MAKKIEDYQYNEDDEYEEESEYEDEERCKKHKKETTIWNYKQENVPL